MNRRLLPIGMLLLAVSCGGGDVAPALWVADGLVTPDGEDGTAVETAVETVVGDDVVHDTVPVDLPPDTVIVNDIPIVNDVPVVNDVPDVPDACVPQCTGLQCGSDGCGGQCGTCQPPAVCGAQGLCVTCTPACTGKTCGDDGCGGQCGVCIQGSVCIDGLCKCTLHALQWCCQDGKGLCWYDSCNNQDEKIQDCSGGCVNNVCSGCIPGCTGKTCGFDGCGGVCGTCTGQDLCVKGNCQCAPACQGKECGSNGCGGSCGTCPNGSQCSANGKCGCAPNCAGRTCGGDGCGGS